MIKVTIDMYPRDDAANLPAYHVVTKRITVLGILIYKKQTFVLAETNYSKTEV